jgi:putative flippase GtrA
LRPRGGLRIGRLDAGTAPALFSAGRFAIVGAAGALVNTAFLSLLYQRLHLALPLSSLGACELAVIGNYVLDDRWAFQRPSLSWMRFAKFNVTAAGGLVLTVALISAFVHLWQLNYLLANSLALAASGLFNLALSLSWIWGRGR